MKKLATATHILIASDQDRDILIDAAVGKQDIEWIVPKRSAVGDRVLLFHRAEGILGQATLSSAPEETESPGRYGATATDLRILRNPVTLAQLRERCPTWGWPTYPRGYTTIPVEVLSEIEPLLRAAE